MWKKKRTKKFTFVSKKAPTWVSSPCCTFECQLIVGQPHFSQRACSVLMFLEDFGCYPIIGLSLLLEVPRLKMRSLQEDSARPHCRHCPVHPPASLPSTSLLALCSISGRNRTWGGIMGSHCSSLDDIMEEDMHHWYTKFMRESPSGLITLFELKTMLEMNGMTDEASSYVDQVFFTFDMDGVRKHLTATPTPDQHLHQNYRIYNICKYLSLFPHICLYAHSYKMP